MTITLNELHDLTIPVAEDFNANFRALKAGQEAIEALAATMVPMVTGAVVDYAGTTAPTGWLLCDGAAVSRTSYAALFGVIGTLYGAGDGSATFNVPDCRSRTTIGAGTGSGLSQRQLAGHGGEEVHALTSAENGPHAHQSSTSSLLIYDGVGPYTIVGGLGMVVTNTQTTESGSGVPHNTMPPYLVLNKIIKT